MWICGSHPGCVRAVGEAAEYSLPRREGRRAGSTVSFHSSARLDWQMCSSSAFDGALVRKVSTLLPVNIPPVLTNSKKEKEGDRSLVQSQDWF